MSRLSNNFSDGKPQPDNHEGVEAGKLRKVSDPVGLTIEGLQEWHDEACLAVLNNKVSHCCSSNRFLSKCNSENLWRSDFIVDIILGICSEDASWTIKVWWRGCLAWCGLPFPVQDCLWGLRCTVGQSCQGKQRSFYSRTNPCQELTPLTHINYYNYNDCIYP